MNGKFKKKQNFTRREVLYKLNKLAEIITDKADMDMNNEIGAGPLFEVQKELELSQFNLKDWLKKNV